jgi:predicted DNA-binding ribbon-helix-helix protein
MKSRVTITLDSDVLRQAKNMARDRKISLSGLIENLLKHSQDQSHTSNKKVSFSSKWAGKLELRKTQNDPLLDAMEVHYKLES